MNFTTTPAPNDVRLCDAHLLELAASGISPEAAAAAGVYTESDPVRVAALLNWGGAAVVLGLCLVIPYLDATGRPTGYHRLKPSHPRASSKKEDRGKTIKYEAPKGLPNRLYIPPGTRAAVADPAVDLLLTEGEKKALAADAAGFACLSVPGVWAWQGKRQRGANGRGSGPRELIDDLKAVAWEGRKVYVVFDSDAATNPNVQQAERALVKVLSAAGATVSVVRLPTGATGEKQGLDDFLQRHGPVALHELLTRSPTPPPGLPPAGGSEEKPKRTASDVLADLASAEAELWHDPTKAGFATIGRKSMAIKSKEYRQWLTRRYREVTGGKVPGGDALTNALNAVEAQAVFDGPEHEAHVRVAYHSGRVYLNLADAADTVIEVDARGWRECPDPPVRFRHVHTARPLPRPERGGSLDDLRALFKLHIPDQFALLVGFLVGVLLPGRPQPLLVINGEQGSGKSTLSRAIKKLIDPAAAPVRSKSGDEKDLMIAARNNHLLAFENLSHLSAELSDAFCRLATGGGFATRELYTNDGEVIFDALRPVILNGIEDFVTRGDLLQRSILLHMPTIEDTERVFEDELWERFNALHPKLLGALLGRVAGGLRKLPSVRLDRPPRMADFARFAVACEQGAGEPPRFLAAYTANQGGAHEQALEGSCVAGAVVAFMAGREAWEGTPTDLLRELSALVPTPAPQDWPKKPNGLTGRLRRLAPHLRRVHGIDFTSDRQSDSGRGRVSRLSKLGKGGVAVPSAAALAPGSSPPDGPPDVARGSDVRPSGPQESKSSTSDGPDGSDGDDPAIEVVSREAYDQFLNLH
jgi:energy-coupling factor transporter ATP-binding protein EcfA2